MWITTTTGYLSVVQGNDDPTVLVVRARIKDDLEPLRQIHQNTHGGRPPKVLAYRNSDYPWRILTSREALTNFLAREVYALDYGNFKSAVGKVQGHARANVYSRVWTALLGLERLDTPKNRRAAESRWDRPVETDEGPWWDEPTLHEAAESAAWSDRDLWDQP